MFEKREKRKFHDDVKFHSPRSKNIESFLVLLENDSHGLSPVDDTFVTNKLNSRSMCKPMEQFSKFPST